MRKNSSTLNIVHPHRTQPSVESDWEEEPEARASWAPNLILRRASRPSREHHNPTQLGGIVELLLWRNIRGDLRASQREAEDEDEGRGVGGAELQEDEPQGVLGQCCCRCAAAHLRTSACSFRGSRFRRLHFLVRCGNQFHLVLSLRFIWVGSGFSVL